MAKLLFTLTALLFLFAFAHARTPSDLPEKEINGRDIPANTNLLESEHRTTTTTTLLLPGEKPDSEPATVVEREPETADAKLQDSDGTTILTNDESTEFKHSETVPLTVISFRPVNRRFPSRRPFPLSFRHGHRCGQGRRHVGPWTPRFQGGKRDRGVVSYGDDMILSASNYDDLLRGGARQIPARWANFRHGGPRFPFRHDDEMEFQRPHHHHRHRHHHDRDHGEEFEGMEKPRERRHEHDREHEGGLMRRFRKFLNHF